jgi:hypothetical protein
MMHTIEVMVETEAGTLRVNVENEYPVTRNPQELIQRAANAAQAFYDDEETVDDSNE